MTGLAILEAAPGQLHTEIDGVKIEANFDNFMDWLRQAALDEVYLDVAQESEENMLPYLEEMESMGLTVHFRLRCWIGSKKPAAMRPVQCASAGN